MSFHPSGDFLLVGTNHPTSMFHYSIETFCAAVLQEVSSTNNIQGVSKKVAPIKLFEYLHFG